MGTGANPSSVQKGTCPRAAIACCVVLAAGCHGTGQGP